MEQRISIELIAPTPGLAESPVRSGTEIWFTDLMVGVLRVTNFGQNAQLMTERRGVGGLVAHAEGGVVASGRSLAHIAGDGAVTELRARPDDSTGFNDLLATSDGQVIAGSLRYRPISGDDPVPGALVRISSDGIQELVTGPAWPNGIALAPDGSGTMYVADFATSAVLRIERGGRSEVFARVDEGSADGLAMDTLGRLWVATGPGGSLVAFNPRGTVDRRVALPAQFVSNVALDPSGGPALVTVGGMADGRGGLLSADLDAEGVPGFAATIPLPAHTEEM